MSLILNVFLKSQKAAIAVLDLILPPRCIGSGDIVDSPGMTSAAFWQSLHFIEPPFCACCGTPFSLDIAAGSLCASCIETEPVFDTARAAVVYNDASRQAVLDFKYGDRMHAVKTFTPWLLRAGAEQLAACDLILPVPLHRRRLWRRRFNQAGILAGGIAAASGTLCRHDILRRDRFTTTQKGLSRKERRMNVKGAFRIAPDRASVVRGKSILLVDDVFTSGATLNECAYVLKAAGAAAVHVLTIARVTRDEAFADH